MTENFSREVETIKKENQHNTNYFDCKMFTIKPTSIIEDIIYSMLLFVPFKLKCYKNKNK